MTPKKPAPNVDVEADGGGGDYNPADLAKEAKGGGSANAVLKNIKLPLYAVLSGVFILVLAMVVVPSSTIFITNSYANSEDSAQTITELTLDSAFNSINSLLNNNRRVAFNFGRNSRTRLTLQNAITGGNGSLWPALQGSDWLKDAFAVTKDNEDISSIACTPIIGPASDWDTPHIQFGLDKWTIKSLMPINSGTYGNLTDLERLLPDGAYWTFSFMEAQFRNTNYKRALNQDAQNLPPQAYSIIMEGYMNTTGNVSNFNRLARATPYIGNQWVYWRNSLVGLPDNPFNSSLAPYYHLASNGTLKHGGSYWSYSNLFGKTYGSCVVAIYNAAKTAISHVCEAGGIFQESLDLYLAKLVPSRNGVIFLFDAKGTARSPSGTLISASVPQAAIPADQNIANGGSLLALDTAWHPTIVQVGTFLRKSYPDLLTMASSGPLSLKTKLSDGKPWYVGARQISVDDVGGKWTIVVAFPRSDFFAAIDSSIQKSIIVIVVLAVVGLLLTLAISFAFTIPLRILVTYMQEATGMKFKFLEESNIDTRSFISEIAGLQSAFSTMVKAFAAGIRKNADLVSARNTRAGSKSQQSQSQSQSQSAAKPLLK